MKTQFKNIFFGFVIGSFFCLILWLLFNVFIEPIYLNQEPKNQQQNISNIISFLSLCATAFIGFAAYEMQKKQKEFNEKQAQLENQRAENQKIFNEKSLTDYQRDFLRKSYLEFMFYNNIIYGLEPKPLAEKERGDERFYMRNRIQKWIEKKYFTQGSSSPISLYDDVVKDEEMIKLLRSDAPPKPYPFSRKASNEIFEIFEDTQLEIEIMGYKDISDLWESEILNKFEIIEREIVKELLEQSRIKSGKEYAAQTIAGAIMAKNFNVLYPFGQEGKSKAQELYQKYLTNKHI